MLKKVFGIVAAAIMGLSVLAIGGQALAQTDQSMWFSNSHRTDSDWSWRHRMNRMSYWDRYMNRHINNRVFVRNVNARFSYNGLWGARQIVIIDRDNSNNFFVVQNRLTGPFSVNRIVIRTDRDNFSRFFNRTQIDQDIDIVANTGNNTVSYNTVVGSIRTGDIDISVD